MKFSDNHDPLHGPRGAALARELRGKAFDLEEAERGLLGFACQEHTNGGVGSDPTGGGVLGCRPIEPVACGETAGSAVVLDGGDEERGAHRVDTRLAVGALRLGGPVSGLQASMIHQAKGKLGY